MRTSLIIEPERALRDLIRLALERLGHRTFAAERTGEALAYLQRQRPRLLLLSLSLPEISGIDWLAELKSQGLLDRTAVIMMSPLGYREVIEGAVKAGASDFIVKPFDVETLIAKVQRVLA